MAQRNEIFELLDAVNRSEDQFILKFSSLQSKTKKIEDVIPHVTLDDWKILFSVFQKDWKRSRKILADFFDLVYSDLPHEVKILPYHSIERFLSDSDAKTNKMGLRSFLYFLNTRKETSSILNKTLSSRLVHFVTENSDLLKISQDIMSVLVHDNSDAEILADDFCCTLEKIPCSRAYFITRTLVCLVKASDYFGQNLSKNDAVGCLLKLYSESKDDVLSCMTMLEDFCDLSSNTYISKYFLDSFLVADIKGFLEVPTNDLFCSSLKLLTHIVENNFKHCDDLLLFLVKKCISIEPRSINWPYIFQSYQSLVFLLTNRQILQYLFEENINLFNDILTFFNNVNKIIPTNQIGDFYQIYSHLFSDTNDGIDVKAALNHLYIELVSDYKLSSMLKSVDPSQQKAALLLILTASSYDWCVTNFSDTNAGPLKVMMDSGIFMHNIENLTLKEDILRMYLNNPLFTEKLSNDTRARLDDILNKRASISQATVRSENY